MPNAAASHFQAPKRGRHTRVCGLMVALDWVALLPGLSNQFGAAANLRAAGSFRCGECHCTCPTVDVTLSCARAIEECTCWGRPLFVLGVVAGVALGGCAWSLTRSSRPRFQAVKCADPARLAVAAQAQLALLKGKGH